MTRFAYLVTALLLILSNPVPLQASQGKTQSLDAAIQQVRQQTGGRILSATTVNNNGQPVHRIKVLLPSGEVRIFKVNQ